MQGGKSKTSILRSTDEVGVKYGEVFGNYE
jgi:hypothetical protein